jgi:hypothetical protein
MEHDTLSSFDCCDRSWPLSAAEELQARLDGIPAYALTSLSHVCCLEPGHEDACACQCGASR